MDSILKWPSGIKAKFTHIVELVEASGPGEVGMPFIKAIGNGLFEIRSNGKEGIGRAFFCMLESRKILILHCFIIKTEQTPNKELDIARRRMREVK